MFNGIEYKRGETFYNNGVNKDCQVFNWRNGILYTWKRNDWCFTELKDKTLFIKLYFMSV